MVGDETESVTVQVEDGRVERLAQAGGALHHGIEYRLDVRRRAGDDAEDRAGRRLLRERGCQLAVCFAWSSVSSRAFSAAS